MTLDRAVAVRTGVPQRVGSDGLMYRKVATLGMVRFCICGACWVCDVDEAASPWAPNKDPSCRQKPVTLEVTSP